MRAQRTLIILMCVISLGGALQAGDLEIVRKLGLASKKIAGTEVYYEKCFADKLEVFEKLYGDFERQRKAGSKLLARKELVISDIRGILAITDANTETAYKMLSELAGPLSEAKVSFVLVTQATTKDYLRSGGELPDFKYDKKTDTAEYRPRFGQESSSEPVKEVQLTVPLPSAESLEKEGPPLMKALAEGVFSNKANIGLAIHEVAEALIYQKIKPKGEYWRWFTDGFANAITYEILKKRGTQDDANSFAEAYGTAEYKDLEKLVNLRYWMKAQYCPLPMGDPIKQERRFTMARYALATYEARRLVDAHGIKCVTGIANELCKKESRTTDDLMAAIKKVTGEDMAERLAHYQVFKTLEEGMPKYTHAFSEAVKARDYEKMLVNLLRIMELHGMKYPDNELQSWSNAAWFLFKLGQEKEADQVMNNCIELYSDTSLPNGRRAALEHFMYYAMRCHKPAKATAAADEVLKGDPNNVSGLTIRMMTQPDLAEAKKIAKTIQTLASSKESMAYKYATSVLELEPNKPPCGK